MTISYTTNFNWPLPDDACENWGAIFNGILRDLDLALAEARNPLIWENDSDDHLLLNTSGKESTSEVLVYDGEILLYA
jgi:hypothetical protein